MQGFVGFRVYGLGCREGVRQPRAPLQGVEHPVVGIRGVHLLSVSLRDSGL